MAKLLGGTRIYGTGTIDTSLVINGTNSATSTASGALTVAGGVGIGGTIYVGSLRGDTTTSATTWGLFYNSVTKEITTATSGSGASGISSTGTTSTFVISSTASSTSTNTGALQVVGGVGIGGNLNVGRNISRNSTTATTTHPLEIIGAPAETTVLGAFRSSGNLNSSLISFQNTSQAITTVAVGTTGSVLLVQASSQYLSIASNATLALGAGDFTVEGFYYLNTGAVPDQVLMDWRNGTNGAGVTQPMIEFQPSGSLGLNWYVNAANRISSGNAAVTFNAWQHFAISRVSGSTRMYLSGNQVGSTYADSNTYPQGSIRIGANNDGGAIGRALGAYVSNIRIIVGTGLYSGTTLTVPTANLTAVTNTRLLLNTVFGGSFLADSSGAGVTVTNNNAATSSPNAPFQGTATTTYGDLVNVGSTGSSLIFQTNAVTRVIVDSIGTVTINSTASSTSTTTGALIVTGGVGIGGGVVVGGSITATTFVTVGTGGGGFITGAGFISASTATITSTIGSTSPTTGALQVSGGVGIGGSLFVSGVVTATNFFAGTLRIDAGSTMTNLVVTGTTTSTSTTTGAVIVVGGVGIGGTLFVGSTSTFTSTTSSNSTTTGALIVAGGVGIGGAVYIGTSSFIAGAQIITTATIGLYAASSGASSTGTTSTFVISSTASSVSTTTGALQVAGGVGIGGGIIIGGISTVTNRTSATNTTTGALQVRGGVGVGDSVYVGNRIGWTSATNVSVVYQFYNTATFTLDTVFG